MAMQHARAWMNVSMIKDKTSTFVNEGLSMIKDKTSTGLAMIKSKKRQLMNQLLNMLPTSQPMLSTSQPMRFHSTPAMMPATSTPAMMPATSTLFELARLSYKRPDYNIGPLVVFGSRNYKVLLRTQTIIIFKDESVKIVIVSVRGTRLSDSKDIIADSQIVLGRLKETDRYKNDLLTVTSFKESEKAHDLKGFTWIGTGHSLGGAIIDEFLKLNLIKEAVTFNPAVSREFYKSVLNRRIYMSRDVLYLTFGRLTKRHEVIKVPKNLVAGIFKSHKMINFENILSASPSPSPPAPAPAPAPAPTPTPAPAPAPITRTSTSTSTKRTQ